MRFDPKRYASPDELKSPRVRWIYDYWRSKANGGLPLRASIDPVEMKSVLPCLLLIDVIVDRFRYRLVGTEVAANAGYDFTGRFLDEQKFANRDFYLACYRDAKRTAQPVFCLDNWAYPDGRSGIAEFAMLPLSIDGTTVTQFLTIEHTMGHDAGRHA